MFVAKAISLLMQSDHIIIIQTCLHENLEYCGIFFFINIKVALNLEINALLGTILG